MKPAALPPDEASRLAALRALEVLDTPAEAEFDALTGLVNRGELGQRLQRMLDNAERATAQREEQALCERLEIERFAHGEQRFRIGASIGLAPLGEGELTDLQAVLQAAEDGHARDLTVATAAGALRGASRRVPEQATLRQSELGRIGLHIGLQGLPGATCKFKSAAHGGHGGHGGHGCAGRQP